MNAPAPTLCASDTAPTPTDAARARIERRMAMLARLAEIGMEIAEACGREVRAGASAADGGAVRCPQSREQAQVIGLVFARVARAVRMTLALEQRLANEIVDLDRADARAEQAAEDARRIRLSRLVGEAARAHVEASLEAGDAAWARRGDADAVEDEIERLADAAYERLTDAEDGFLEGLSFDEAVAAVAKDLGLTEGGCAQLMAAVRAPSPPPPVVLGPVPRIQGSRADRPCTGALDPRDKSEDDDEAESLRVPGSFPRIRAGPPEDDG